MPKPTEPKNIGRPRLANNVAKGSIVPARFSTEDRKRVEVATKASGKTVSAWIRSTLSAALESV